MNSGLLLVMEYFEIVVLSPPLALMMVKQVDTGQENFCFESDVSPNLSNVFSLYHAHAHWQTNSHPTISLTL